MVWLVAGYTLNFMHVHVLHNVILVQESTMSSSYSFGKSMGVGKVQKQGQPSPTIDSEGQTPLLYLHSLSIGIIIHVAGNKQT